MLVRYGDIVPVNTLERIYATCLCLIGGLLYPAAIGAAASLITNVNPPKRAFEQRKKDMHRVLVTWRVKSVLRQQITLFYDFLWKSQRVSHNSPCSGSGTHSLCVGRSGH